MILLARLLACVDDGCVDLEPVPGCLPVEHCCTADDCRFVVVREWADNTSFECATPEDCDGAQQEALAEACGLP